MGLGRPCFARTLAVNEPSQASGDIGEGGAQEVVSTGKEESALGAGQQLRAPCPPHASLGTLNDPPTAQAPCTPLLHLQALCADPRLRRPAVGRVPTPTPLGTPRSGGVRKAAAGSPVSALRPRGSPLPPSAPSAVPGPRRELRGAHCPHGEGSREPGHRQRRARGCGHQAAGISGTVGPPGVPEPGPSVRARPTARNHGSRSLGAQSPSAPQQPPRCQGGGGGPGRELAPAPPPRPRGHRGAKRKDSGSPRRGAPAPGGQREGPQSGGALAGSARGGVPAGTRTRGCGARRGARAANPQLAPPAPPARAVPGGGRRRGEPRRGGARSSPAAGTAGAASGLVGIPGAVAAPTFPQNRGARERGHRRRSPAVSAGCGARRRLAFPVPSSLGPPYSLPRYDPAAKGWAGKRALWDRCQLRDKRHKIGGNGGSAAGALGRGRRRRGGRILGADPGKFGKSPRSLRSGGGRAARVALRAALALSAPLLNNSWRGRRPLACTGRAARLCQAAAAFGALAAPDERPLGGRAHAVPAPARPPGGAHCAPARPAGPSPSPPATRRPPDGPALQVLARDARSECT
ncbi:uncharacterized protein LOC103787805 [Callithrix jacchus]